MKVFFHITLTSANRNVGAVTLSPNHSITLSLPITLSFLITLSLLTFHLSAQDLIPVKGKGKWGLQDPKGKMLTDFRYDTVFGSNNGFVIVGINDKYGYVNKEGREITPLKYRGLSEFYEGFASVNMAKNDTANWETFIDENGKEVIPFRYDLIWGFEDGLARVHLGDKVGFINTKGEEVIPVIYHLLNGYEWGTKFSCGTYLLYKNPEYPLWGLVDRNGKELTEFSFEEPYQQYDRERVDASGIINLYKSGTGKGYFDLKTGKAITPLKYDWAYSFSGGLGFVKLGKQRGFVDAQGKEFLYEDAHLDTKTNINGLKKGGKWAYARMPGKELTPFKYDEIEAFSEGFGIVEVDKLVNGKKVKFFGLVDSTGKEITEIKYQSLKDKDHGLFLAQLNGKYGFINDKEKTIIPFIYDDAFSFKGDYTLAKKAGGWGIIDRQGQEISAFVYKHNWANDGMTYCPSHISLERDGKDGLVEMATGKELTSFRYSWMTLYGDKDGNIKYVGVGLPNDTSGFVDLKGNEYINTGNYSYGWMLHKGKWGYVRSYDKILTEFKYDEGKEMTGYYAPARMNGKWGLIDTAGREVLACVHDTITIENEDLIYAKKGGKWGIFDGKLKQKTPFKYDMVVQYRDDPYTRVSVGENETWLDRSFREITAPKYGRVEQFREGYAVMGLKRESGGEYDFLYGAIDSTGKELFPFEYSQLDGFYSGLSVAVKGGTTGLIDPKGKAVVPFIYSDARRLDDKTLLMMKNGKWGLLRDGKEVSAFQYDLWIEKIELEIEKIEVSDGIMALRKGDKYGFIDVLTGKELGEFKYDYVWQFGNGIAQVTLGNDTYFIDKNGNRTEPPKYEGEY